MAPRPQLLVQMTLTFLLFPTDSYSKNSSGIWLLNVREKELISVSPNENILSSTSDPTLYNLFRVHTYQERFHSLITFTIESLATNTFICMDKKGNLFTKGRITEMTIPGRKQKRSPPSEQCVFRSWNFGKGEWNQMIGIYMDAPKSNGTKGFFIAFNKRGHPRRFRRHFKTLTKSHSLLISMQKPKNLRKIIRRTRFQRCDGLKGSRAFNRSVRRCLEPDLLQGVTNLTGPGKVTSASQLHRKNIFKLIHRCQKEVERSLCSTKLESKINNKRSKGHKNSQDRQGPNDTTEEFDQNTSCHCLH